MVILAGDIGGTHTRLALFEKGVKRVEEKFLSKSYLALEVIVEEFLQGKGVVIETACFGIAGPIRNGKCKATNLPWIVDAAILQEKLKIHRVYLLNDLEANAYGITCLKEEELNLLQEGKGDVVGHRALISAGTGLGEAFLFWNGSFHVPIPSEGGHADFAPKNELEIELLRYLQKQFSHVSYERVVSGPGLVSIFEFLIDTKRAALSAELKEKMKEKNFSKVISSHALHGLDEGCIQALDIFLSIYGSETGNIALKFLPFGGIFIGGGIAPAILEKLKTGSFLSSYLAKGRFQSLLESIPIRVILNDDTALLGAASYAGKKKPG